MDLSNYDIANYLGHKALSNLFRAYRIYKVPISVALSENGISGFNYDFKEDHDIERESLKNTVCDIDVGSVDPINAFHFAGHLSSLRRKEAEHCIDTAIYFQAMMEADINDVLGSNASGSFKSKWTKFLKSNGASSKELGYFDNYLNNIYKKIRIPTVHAPDRKGLTNVDALRFPFVHENIKYGWYSFVFLLNIVHDSKMDYEENWEIMSNQAHGIPDQIDEGDYPDYGSITGQLNKKHLDHFNKKS